MLEAVLELCGHAAHLICLALDGGDGSKREGEGDAEGALCLACTRHLFARLLLDAAGGTEIFTEGRSSIFLLNASSFG